jgi:hypothetical protein
VIMRSAPSDIRTALRAVSRIAMPEESSQKAATWTVTPAVSAPRSGRTGASPVTVRNDAKAAGVAAAATTVAAQRRQPGSSP